MDTYTLFLAVLIQVVVDIRSTSKKPGIIKIKKESAYWLAHNECTFKWVCFMANIEPTQTRKALQELIKMDAETFHTRMAPYRLGMCKTYEKILKV